MPSNRPDITIPHPAVQSDIYRLVATYEFDLQVGGQFHPTRIELFRDTQRNTRWRARLWDVELCRLEPSPVDRPPAAGTRARAGRRGREAFDEDLLIERTWMLGDEFGGFVALTEAKALARVIDALLEHLGPSGPPAVRPKG